MIKCMYADILFDREITDEHYISPGDVCLIDNTGDVFSVGFKSSDQWVYYQNDRVLHIEQWYLELNHFPHVQHLDNHLKNLKEINEFYIYTGEKNEDSEINPVKILNMEFYDEDDKVYKIKSSQYKHALDWVIK